MYFPTAHFLFCNSEIFYNDRLKLISKVSIEKKNVQPKKIMQLLPLILFKELCEFEIIRIGQRARYLNVDI